MMRSLKLAVASHLLLWSLCRGTPKEVSGGTYAVCGVGCENIRCVGATPRPEDESGQVTMFIKSKPDRPADCTMVVVSFAAKSIHNYLCIMFDKWGNMVRTRAKWEIEEDEKAKKNKR